jgi:hypothetical protein
LCHPAAAFRLSDRWHLIAAPGGRRGIGDMVMSQQQGHQESYTNALSVLNASTQNLTGNGMKTHFISH